MMGADDAHDADPATYDRHRELKRFDDSKAGVKGLADSGVARLPRFFLRPPEDIAADRPGPGLAAPAALEIPVIDLGSLAAGSRPAAVARVLEAAREVGFFQVVNHGIPEGVLAGVLAAGRAFHELPAEVKAGYYSREGGRRVKFTSNFDLYESKHANWRDTMFCVMGPEPLDSLELPPVCRDMMMEYSKQVKALGNTLFELLSEALGLKPDHLVKMDCAKGHALLCHYYPACPEPDLTMGTTKHSDPDFLTILLQDHIGGLQIYYRDQWVDVPPVAGALVVNIGDLLQLISNDIFKSVWHRVLASHVGPRLSVACFFTLHLYPTTRTYGPIKEILSEDGPALYREISLREFVTYYDSKGLDGTSALTHFRLAK
ncbi:hypothetical protein ACJRO7_031863 [Eucalyptus globulus]|uniref:Fe2OG dioxygenase domain-containing protein n=1 Tax=Eucalyptus globulus TaxID=34317 RepID=A0ABD3JHK3_EUCGL